MVDSAWNPLSFLWHSLEVFGMLLKDGENFEKIFVFFFNFQLQKSIIELKNLCIVVALGKCKYSYMNLDLAQYFFG